MILVDFTQNYFDKILDFKVLYYFVNKVVDFQQKQMVLTFLKIIKKRLALRVFFILSTEVIKGNIFRRYPPVVTHFKNGLIH